MKELVKHLGEGQRELIFKKYSCLSMPGRLSNEYKLVYSIVLKRDTLKGKRSIFQLLSSALFLSLPRYSSVARIVQTVDGIAHLVCDFFSPICLKSEF